MSVPGISRYYIPGLIRDRARALQETVTQIHAEVGDDCLLFVRPFHQDGYDTVLIGIRRLNSHLASVLRMHLLELEAGRAAGSIAAYAADVILTVEPAGFDSAGHLKFRRQEWPVKQYTFGNSLSDFAWALAVETPEGVVFCDVWHRPKWPPREAAPREVALHEAGA